MSSIPVEGTGALCAQRVKEVAARSDWDEPWRDVNGVRVGCVFVRCVLFVVRTMIAAIVAAADVLLSRLHAVCEANAARLWFTVLADTVRVCMCVYTPRWPSQRPRDEAACGRSYGATMANKTVQHFKSSPLSLSLTRACASTHEAVARRSMVAALRAA